MRPFKCIHSIKLVHYILFNWFKSKALQHFYGARCWMNSVEGFQHSLLWMIHSNVLCAMDAVFLQYFCNISQHFSSFITRKFYVAIVLYKSLECSYINANWSNQMSHRIYYWFFYAKSFPFVPTRAIK